MLAKVNLMLEQLVKIGINILHHHAYLSQVEDLPTEFNIGERGLAPQICTGRGFRAKNIDQFRGESGQSLIFFGLEREEELISSSDSFGLVCCSSG